MLDPATQDKVKQQVEFYFSDSNLPRDRFLSDRVAAEPEGFVDLALLCTFQRMQGLLKSNVGDAAKVAEQTLAGVAQALAPSLTLVLSDDKLRVRRRVALNKPVEEVGLEVDERSVYASPFPFDAGLDEIVAFFGAAGAAVNSVRMRRHLVSKDFKGSAFVEFATKEEAEGVAGAALTFKGAPLVLRPKGEYVKEKAEARHARPNSPHNPEAAAGAAARPAKRAREEGGEEAEDGGEAAAAPAAPAPVFVPGCVVHFDFGADAAFGDAVTFGLVKDSFGGREAGLQYVDYAPGDKEGHARFDAPAAAAAALAAGAGGKMMVAGYEAAVRVLEGEEEVGYMGRVASQRAERERREGGGGRGGGRRGRGRGRGRGGGGGRRGRGRQ